MGEPISIHDPARWNLLFDATAIQGFGDGDIISLEPPTEMVMAKVGVKGEIALAIKSNTLHSLKINLHQTSRTNTILRGFFRAQYIPGTIVPRVCSLRNTITAEAWNGIAWLVSEAPLKVGAEVQNNEWEFGFAVSAYSPAIIPL